MNLKKRAKKRLLSLFWIKLRKIRENITYNFEVVRVELDPGWAVQFSSDYHWVVRVWSSVFSTVEENRKIKKFSNNGNFYFPEILHRSWIIKFLVVVEGDVNIDWLCVPVRFNFRRVVHRDTSIQIILISFWKMRRRKKKKFYYKALFNTKNHCKNEREKYNCFSLLFVYV